MTNNIARIALTPGEPGGIGADICLSLAQQQQQTQFVIFADPELLEQRAALLKLPIELVEFDQQQESMPSLPGQLNIVHVKLAQTAIAGQLNPANGAYVLQCLEQATLACLSNQMDALVTGPVHKGIINEAGFSFTGHTEYLAEISAANSNEQKTPVMMLQTPGLRVALVTTHLPLMAVSDAITATSLSRVIEILHRDLRRYLNKTNPTIFISGLNPHAGEDGHLGHEEINTIIPVIEQYKKQGMDVHGPLPADTMFSKPNCAQADVFLCMYHDQGLPVLKYQGFGEAVNVTLGLPFIRTSVDHGTALALAGTGQASNASLQYAIETAHEMIQSKQNHQA